MAVDTTANLLVRANAIRTETAGAANSASRVGGLIRDIIDSATFGTEYTVRPSLTATGDENRLTIQAGIDAARTAGGGRVRIAGTPGGYPLTAPYRGTDGIYTGYVASDEIRRANKALIIYDADNIEIYADPGVVLDRSGDQVADATYASYSTTIYVSKSKNVYLHDLNFLGLQSDADLLDDIKTVTSGNHIQINNACDGVVVENIIAQDGGSAVEIGLARTAAYASLDPAIGWCRNVFMRNIQSRNNEQGLLLCKVDGFEVDGFSEQTWQRADLTTGVCQRALYIHSCKNGHLRGIDLRGAYKTSVLVANYAPVTNVVVDGLTILNMFTPKQFIDSGRADGAIDLNWEGHGISMQTDNCDGVTFRNVKIDGVCICVALPGFGMGDVLFDGFRLNGARSGMTQMPNFDVAGWSPVLLNNPIDGLTLLNGHITNFEDAVNYVGVDPTSGLYVDSSAVDGGAAIINAGRVKVRNVTVEARDRNARLLHCNGTVSDCTFTRNVGFAGARDFDFNYSGTIWVESVTCGNEGSPNKTDDVPTAAEILGTLHISGTGTPEAAVVASPGSTFRRTDGGAGTCFYVKESGTGTNTGWVGK